MYVKVRLIKKKKFFLKNNEDGLEVQDFKANKASIIKTV